jgi:hypothetical protein
MGEMGETEELGIGFLQIELDEVLGINLLIEVEKLGY